MWTRAFLFCGVLLAWTVPVLGQGGQETPPAISADRADLPVVLGARLAEQIDRTRFVFEVSDPVKLRVFTLSDPNRVVIDMPEVIWALNDPDRPSGKGAVKSYRYGLFRPGDSRFVIDLNVPVTPAEPMILPPSGGSGYRLVVDLFPATAAKFEEAAGWPADLRAQEKRAEAQKLASLIAAAQSPKPKAAAVKKIVLVDPGHGGIDSGTVGVDGLKEKDLVLDEGKRLAAILQKRGYIVHLTRDSDVYIPLMQRVDIARGYDADLFISLHADSNPDPSVTGASVYTLSEKGSDREAALLAKKENQSDVIAGVDLTGESNDVSHILIDLAQRQTMNRSDVFAQNIVQQLSHVTDVIASAPHRSAGFVVLKAPDVPAVLVELGYLSNVRDCDQMGTDAWRAGVAQAIADAVDRHFHPQIAATPGPSLAAARSAP
jgi:N-acetylmuramoyl-L-alanine amidase